MPDEQRYNLNVRMNRFRINWTGLMPYWLTCETVENGEDRVPVTLFELPYGDVPAQYYGSTLWCMACVEAVEQAQRLDLQTTREIYILCPTGDVIPERELMGARDLPGNGPELPYRPGDISVCTCRLCLASTPNGWRTEDWAAYFRETRQSVVEDVEVPTGPRYFEFLYDGKVHEARVTYNRDTKTYLACMGLRGKVPMFAKKMKRETLWGYYPALPSDPIPVVAKALVGAQYCGASVKEVVHGV